MDEEAVAQFVSFTSSTPDQAIQYLRLTDGDIQQAIDLFYANDGNDLSSSAQAPPTSSTRTRPPGRSQRGYEDSHGIVHLDSDSEFSDDENPDAISTNLSAPAVSARSRPSTHTPSRTTPPTAPVAVDDDEAMALRLQEEIYAGAGAREATGADPDGLRAPIGRTTETLVGPGSFDPSNADELRAAVLEQMRARQQPRRQREPRASTIWDHSDQSSHLGRVANVGRGASTSSSKSSQLAEMYRPPYESISPLSWDQARDEGKLKEKWLLVNIQDPSIFDCQVLNRDLWKNADIMETVRENFIFMQFTKNDPRGDPYIQFYFQSSDNQDLYPHIAIVDPRTGEQVKIWSGVPSPKAMDFLMQLHEFLDRYSLSASARNPAARRKPNLKNEIPVEKMTEDQMLEMALQNSLVGSEASKAVDPDELTRSDGNVNPGRGTAEETEVGTGEGESTPLSQFALISSSHAHSEPPPNDPFTTRIQFRHPTGRIVRRFALSDPVRRIYEWLKASPFEGKEGVEFELIFLQKNLITVLDETIEEAGLKNGAVMVEFLEGSG